MVMYMKPIEAQLEMWETSTFPQLSRCLRPVLHTICLSYANSKYFGHTSSYVVTVFTNICNFIINLVRFFQKDIVFELYRISIMLIALLYLWYCVFHEIYITELEL